MPSAGYFKACEACGYKCDDGFALPLAYKTGWIDGVDPSVNFRWESHISATPTGQKADVKGDANGYVNGGALEKGEMGNGKEKLGCWICWEYDNKWIGGMESEEWYKHMRRHFFVEGYRICKGKTGGMQRRRNCGVVTCPKIHS